MPDIWVKPGCYILEFSKRLYYFLQRFKNMNITKERYNYGSVTNSWHQEEEKPNCRKKQDTHMQATLY